MKHFITFYKSKGLHLAQGVADNEDLAHQINHELMKYGFVVTKELFDMLASQPSNVLNEVYSDIISGITKIVGGSGYEPIYKNFPQSVLQLSHKEFVMNAITHYWSRGTWRPTDASVIKREFAIEPINYKQIKLMTKFEFINIFYNVIYSNNSISAFDKKIIDWYVLNGVEFDFSSISFKETQAYVGKQLFDTKDLVVLPIKDATLILRLWSAYSGGDEGLKANTKFKKPTNPQRRVLRNTLEQCYNIEESFKGNREKWLRLLFYINPMKYDKTHPILYKNTYSLRNTPKLLKTFNSVVEEGLKNKDASVLTALSKRMGVFTRRLDHCVRVFGIQAINVWIECNPRFQQMVIAYNHFTTRDVKMDRAAVLAGMGSSEVVGYKALAPLPSGIVATIREKILDRMKLVNTAHLGSKKVFIDHSLYYRPIASNNRASSMSLHGTAKGTLVDIPKGKTIRMYIHWVGKNDIDLSGMVINENGRLIKVGWNGRHSMSDGSMVYSGDNTGYSAKNAEYIDIDTTLLQEGTEWVILDARVYSPQEKKYSDYPSGDVVAGWMIRDKPHANEHWLPDTLANASVIECDSNNVFLMALHIPSRKLVHLDVSMQGTNVMGTEDARKMAKYLEKLVFITTDDDEETIPWKVINQGQILNLLSNNVVLDPEDADIIYDENTNSEEVSRLLSIS